METAEQQKRYLGLPPDSLDITWVRVRRLLLLYLASSILTFSTVPVFARLSEHARSMGKKESVSITHLLTPSLVFWQWQLSTAKGGKGDQHTSDATFAEPAHLLSMDRLSTARDRHYVYCYWFLQSYIFLQRRILNKKEREREREREREGGHE